MASNYEIVRRLNRKIENYRRYDFGIPSLKPEAKLYNVVIRPRGTNKEGRILSYNEANQAYMKNNKGETLSQELYNEKLNDLNSYLKNFTIRETKNEYAEVAERIASSLYGEDSREYHEFMKLSTKHKSEMLQDLKTRQQENPQGYDSSQVFDEYIKQRMDPEE